MPGKQHHEVLVFHKTVWLSLSFDETRGSQQWRIYRRTRRSRGGRVGPWWAGLIPKRTTPYDRQNAGLPIPLLRAYAFTEWSWDTPQRPNGTDLWVPDYDAPNAPHQFTIWYSQLNWQDFLSAGEQEQGWWYMGEQDWMA